ncbi:MAG TPA: choice-of-anchor Q domain-containing protein, partial [Pirellulales bacterium]
NGNGSTLTVTDCNFTNCQATNTNWGGGALANFGSLTLDGCTFSGNSATKGGAIWIAAAATSASITNSTFENNTADQGAVVQDESANLTLLAINDTLHGNTATGTATGVIQVTPSAAVSLTNCTIVGNTSGTGASGAVNVVGGQASYINTIVADNTGSQFVSSSGGTLSSLGHNISSDGTGNLSGAGDQPNTEPLLGPLQNNGGIVQTMAPLATSPAINAGDNAAGNLPATDARGIARTLNGTVDIGAVESIMADTTADNDDANYGSGQLSLREAIGLAPTGTAVLLSSGIAGGTIDLSAGGGGVGTTLEIGKDLAIDATELAGGLAISGGNAIEILNIDSNTTVALTGLTITGGNAGASDGGGIQNNGTLSLTDCTISNNTAADGAGIINYATLTIVGCTFSGNQAEAITGSGGAIWSTGSSVVTASNSTFNGNSAAYGGAVEYDPATPGVFTNDTFYGNTASGSQTGIVEVDTVPGEIDLINCTITGNTANDPNSGSVSAYGGTVQYVNTLVANNTTSQFVSNASGTLISLGHNLSSDGTGNLTAAGDLGNTDPLLSPLANYGGATSTLALLPGSPAIDAGSTADAPAQDQRGVNRLGAADIGAFESRGFTLAATSGSGQTANVGANFAALTVTVTSAFGEPVQNGLVRFAAPATGPSATFAGSPATIDGAGHASIAPQANLLAGSYLLTAGDTEANTVGFSLTNHGAASLLFTQQPTNVVSGTAITPAVAVEILDETGALFSTNATVTLAANGPGDFAAGSTASLAAVNGVATFNNLTLDAAGRYTLSASSANVPTLVSQSFHTTATHLVFLSQPAAGLGGLVTAVAAAEDVLGNVDPNFQGTVTLTIASGGGGFSGATSLAATGGVATFVELRPTSTALDSTATASAASLSSATSAQFNLVLVSSVAPIAAPNPIFGAGPNADVSTAIIRGLYRTILGRDADSGGLQSWTGQLVAGVSTQTIVHNFWYSAEHRGQEIDQFYLTYLHRPSDTAGRAAWLQLLVATGSEGAVVAAMLSSAEYLQNHSGASAWITSIYNDVLGRAPGGAELQYWQNVLAAGATTSQVVQAIVSSAESNARIVGAYYAAILHRSPDAAGQSSWLGLMAAGTADTSSAAAAFFASPEYQTAARATV